MAVRTVPQAGAGRPIPDPYVVGPRLAAILLDSFIVIVLQGLLSHYFPVFHMRIQDPHALNGSLTLGFNRQDRDLVSGIGLAASLYFVYFLLFEVILAATPGKLIAGLRVVNLDGTRASWQAAVIRNLFRPIDIVGAYALGGIVMLASSRRQRIGDHAAGTLVVSDRSAANASPASGRTALLLRSLGVLLLLAVVAGGVSYLVPPPLVIASGEPFYPVNGAVVGGGPPGARSVSSARVIGRDYTPGTVVYRLRFELTTHRRRVRERCEGLVTFHWTGALDGWMYENYQESCTEHRVR